MGEPVIAMVERSSGIASPVDLPGNEPYYLNQEDALYHDLLHKSIEGSFAGAERGDGLSEE